MEFHDGNTLIARFDATVKEEDKYFAFFKSLPPTPLELKPGHMDLFLAQKVISRESPEGKTSADWAIAHRVGVPSQAMLKVLKDQYEQPHGVALLPHGAAAVKVKTDGENAREGLICCGPPTIFKTNSCAWIHGSFALLSSRKTLPLPEEGDVKPSLDKQWNKMLLEGPIAESMRGLILHCSALVLFQSMSLERYMYLFPIRGDRLVSLLAIATFKKSMTDAVFPVRRGKQITFEVGPTPTFHSAALHEEIQDMLVLDGLKLVTLPPEVLVEYEEALGKPRKQLEGVELCTFLKDTFARLHPAMYDSKDAGKETQGMDFELENTGLKSLASKDYILPMLQFCMRGCWKDWCKKEKADGKLQKSLTFCPQELRGVPLLLTHSREITTFGSSTKFTSWRDILPSKKELFMDKDAHEIAEDAIDANSEDVQKSILAAGDVKIEIPGVRVFTLKDLLPYRKDVELSIIPTKSFMYSGNEPLRLFWSLVADTYAESMQQTVDAFANQKRHLVGCEGPSTILKSDTKWANDIKEWRLLPICSTDGGGDNGENCVAVKDAEFCVAVTLVAQDPAIVESLTGIIQDCGIDTIQHDAMSDDRISRLIRTLCVCDNESLLNVLIRKGNFEQLSALQRHDLLAYFSMLCVKGGVNLDGVRRLPVFKTAQVDGKFIAMEEKCKYVCVDPADKHSDALSILSPPGLVMLAWPTQQVKPIYEYCNAQLLNGEDFMVTSVIPQLPKIVEGDKDGLISFPFLSALHEFCCLDQSDKVIRVAAEAPFVPSEDYSRMAMPREFTSPAGNCAKAFIELLSSYLPVLWMQQNLQHMELLHALGLEACLSSHQILLCAQELDQSATRAIIDADSECTAVSLGGTSDARSLRQKSFELVEEFARAAEEVWPKSKPLLASTGNMIGDAPSEPPRVEDMSNLIKAAMLRILIARRHRTDKTKKQEANDRNGKKWKDLKDAPGNLQVQAHAELELVPLYGCAFKDAKQVLWSICPMEDHRSRPAANDSIHFKNLIDFHCKGMFKVFGCYVLEEQAPPDLVMEHLSALVKLQETDPGEASVKTDSALHEDVRACWKHLSETLPETPKEDITDEFHKALTKLKALPCCAVTLEDVSDKKVEVTNLTIPRHAFFQLPLLKGKEANLRLYLRQVLAETSKESSLFRLLGATDRPRASDFAGASERVAAKAEELGRANWEWVVVCLDACVRGVYEDLSDLSTKKHENLAMELGNLHLFTLDGSVMRVGALVWADEPRYQKRCEKGEVLRFCALNGQDQRHVAEILVKHAGLRQLSNLVEERRVIDASGNEEVEREFKDTVLRLTRSSELACGLHAVILNNNKGAERTVNATISDLTKDLQQLVFKSIKSTLRSALYWTEPEKAGDGAIPGSEQEQQVYYDETDKSIYIGEVLFGPNEDVFTAELVFSLRRALPLLWNVDNFLLEAMLRCALTHGVGGIMPFLEKRDIKVDVLAPRHLGPGDGLPEDLQDHLEWQMEATFGEGETVAVQSGTGSTFTIAEVSKWPDEQSVGEGLNRSYLVRISSDSFEARKHFEVYKIRNKTTVEESTDLVPVGGAGEESKDKINVDVNEESMNQDKEDAKAIADIKQYLHEMAKMQPSDYKAVMRRLFKTWHPDKVGGDTPTAARIFHLLRTHEQWYKKRQNGEVFGDDSWLDNDDDLEKMNSKSKDGEELLALPSTEPIPKAGEDPKDVAGGSWFTEFEREMQEARAEQDKHDGHDDKKNRFAAMGSKDDDKEENAADLLRSAPIAAVDQTAAQVAASQDAAGEQITPTTRVVDKQLAPRYLKEAKLEVVAARRMMADVEGLASLASRAVWHCQQAVEMALRAAMLRTCGIADEEAIGGAAHDLIDFIARLKTAEVNTEEQRRAQSEVPLTEDDVKWFKHAYLAARYPKPGRYGVPGLLYNEQDAERALRLSEDFIAWSARVEDLPDPSKFRRRRWTLDKEDEQKMIEEKAKKVPPPKPKFSEDGYMEDAGGPAKKLKPADLQNDSLFAQKPKPTSDVQVGDKRPWRGPTVIAPPGQDADAGMAAKKTKRWGNSSG
jgi:HEPN domain-containing protein